MTTEDESKTTKRSALRLLHHYSFCDILSFGGLMARPGSRPPWTARKDRRCSAFGISGSIYGLIVALCFALFLVFLLLSTSGSDSSDSSGALQRLSRRLRPDFLSKRRPVRKLAAVNTFGTIFHSDLRSFYNAETDKPLVDKLIAALRQMQDAGITTVVYSTAWQWAEPKPGKIRYEYINMLMDCACHNTGLKVDFILDLVHAPEWIWQRYHDGGSHDADDRHYALLSWFHPLGNEASRRFLSAVSLHLATNYPGCAVAIQPVYNNEYEAKFTQEHDSYQDYSQYARLEYRNWLKAKGVSLAHLNVRWSTNYNKWEDVVPPLLHSGNFAGVDFSARYWDWLTFREEFGAGHYNRACQLVHEAGLKCFHHFPEFFSVLDAMYGASMFKHIAASPYTDLLIMDSNFRTPYLTVMDPVKLRLYVGAAHSYGKHVAFEAAVERFADFNLIRQGFEASLLAGADSLGITNWHDNVAMNESFTDTLRRGVPQCRADEVVGVFLHLDSCAAFHGLQTSWERRDPLHDFVEDLAERLSTRCGTDLAVFIELDRFLAAIPSFSRVVFVEPLVLRNSTELASYVATKAALQAQRLPVEILHLPANITSGPQLVVLQDLTPILSGEGSLKPGTGGWTVTPHQQQRSNSSGTVAAVRL